MCTLAIYFRTSDRYPLVVAANRDEFLERPARPPAVVAESPWVVAGTDLVAGGTWLGLNEHNLVVSVLNRRTGEKPDPTLRSRGLLCSELLRCSTASEAIEHFAADRSAYNPFNLLVASPSEAYVISNFQSPATVTALEPGLHLITNLSLNDPTCPRIAKSHRLFEAAIPRLEDEDSEPFRKAVRGILSDHSTPLDPRYQGPPTNLCVHLGAYGTRCSSVLMYAESAARTAFWHADGAPCETAHQPLSLPR